MPYDEPDTSVGHNMPNHAPKIFTLLALVSTSVTATVASDQDKNNIRPDKPDVNWILQRIKSINQAEIEAINQKNAIDNAVTQIINSGEFDHLSSSDIKEARKILIELEDILVDDRAAVHVKSDRSGRGLLDMFASLADIRQDSGLVRGGNQSEPQRGIFEFVSEVAGNILGGVSDKNDGPVLIPNHCWYGLVKNTFIIWALKTMQNLAKYFSILTDRCQIPKQEKFCKLKAALTPCLLSDSRSRVNVSLIFVPLNNTKIQIK